MDSSEEDDIWNYRSSIYLKKSRSRNDTSQPTQNHESNSTTDLVDTDRSSNKVKVNKTVISKAVKEIKTSSKKKRNKQTKRQSKKGDTNCDTTKLGIKETEKLKKSDDKISRAGSCPKCQVPFTALSIQTPTWHITECLNEPVPKTGKDLYLATYTF